jgi:ELWxxDGT repeat protein
MTRPPLTLFLLTLSLSSASAAPTLRLVRDLNRTPLDYSPWSEWMMDSDTNLVFPKADVAHGAELWCSDGTPQGTRLLKDIVPGEMGSQPQHPVKLPGGEVVFRVRVRDDFQLWLTDGTAEGTRHFADLPADLDTDTAVQALRTESGYFYLAATYPEDSRGVWFTDGTPGNERELNPRAGGTGSGSGIRARFGSVREIMSDGTWCYIIANGDQVWRSDGSEEGTTLLLDAGELLPYAETVQLGMASDLEGRLLLRVSRNFFPPELWSFTYQGAAPRRVAAGEWQELEGFVATAAGTGGFFRGYRPGPQATWRLHYTDGTEDSQVPLPLVLDATEQGFWPLSAGAMMGGHYYFGSYGSAGGALWRSDGTPQGTVMLARLGDSIIPAWFPPLLEDGVLRFEVQGVLGTGVQLWQTDGTVTGTAEVKTKIPAKAYGSGFNTQAAGGEFYVQTNSGEGVAQLWKLGQGRRDPVALLRPERITASAFSSNIFDNHPYTALNGNIVAMVQGRGRSDQELWRIRPKGKVVPLWKSPRGRALNQITFLGEIGGQAIFPLWQDTGRVDFWITNGRHRGTRLLKEGDTEVGTGGSEIAHAGGRAFWTVVRQADYEALWTSDGTAAGTHAVRTADGTLPVPLGTTMYELDGGLYFIGMRPYASGAGLWRTDGTAEGTVEVKTNWDGIASAEPYRLARVGGRLFIAVHAQNYGSRLWTSDGTTAGTQRIHAEPLPAGAPGNLDYPMHDLGGVLIFGEDGAHPQWWRSDGTAAGTHPLVPGVNYRQYGDLDPYWRASAVAGGLLYYAGCDADLPDNPELWVTDGTAAGTRKVKEIYPGPFGSSPQHLTPVGNAVYFRASHPDYGQVLWRSDGTEEGTVMVTDPSGAAPPQRPDDLKVMNGKLHFTAERRATGRELFVVEE